MAELVTDVQRQPRREVLSSLGSLTPLDWIALVLTIIGGLNWGLIGAFDFNLIAVIFGSMSVVSRVIYGLVGVAAIYLIAVSGRLGRKRGPG